MGDILVVNSGSSSIKVAVFDADLAQRHRGSVSEIGSGRAALDLDGAREPVEAADHGAALAALLKRLAARGCTLPALDAAAHRVVHGGTSFSAPALLTPGVVAGIEACVPLAPLHNPANLAGIRALAALAPGLPQFASFDTAFHRTNPEVAQRYAVPPAAEALGIRRYGFHGTSYAALVRCLPAISGAPLPARLLACHLGNGASLCAIADGRSVATTMGYSPLEGLTMGTRAGGIDGNAVLRLVAEFGIDRAARILNHESGLLGLSGVGSDMRALEQNGGAAARFAIEHFCYWAVRHAGSLIAAMGGVDAIAFTGGIGENASAVRAAILDGLAWAGTAVDAQANARNAPRLHAAGARVAAWIVPAEEERQIAADALAAMAKSHA